MAGLLDYIGNNGGALGAYLKSLDDATRSFVPPGMMPRGAQSAIDLPSLLGRIDRYTGDKMGLGSVAGSPAQAAPSSGLSQSDFNQRFGAMQPPAQQPQAPAPTQMQTPQQAQQAFNTPDNSFQWGNQTFPMYGGPQMAQADPAAIPPNAQMTAGRSAPVAIPNNPQEAPPSFQSELLGAAPKQSFLDKFINAFDSPAAYDAKNAQKETARGMYEVFRAQGMSPNEAAAKAVIAARNPEVLKEQMSRFKNIEERAANQPGQVGGMQALTDLEKAKELGKKQADSQNTRETLQLELPGLTADAAEHLRQVEALRNHPGRKGNPFWHSKLGGYLPDSAIPGNTDAGDAVNRLNGIKGGAFLEAFKTLKGGGQITEIEGKKATDAIARMNRATSEAEFNSALDDYSGAIKRGVDKLNATAGMPPPGGFRGNDGWQTLPGGVKIRPKQ